MSPSVAKLSPVNHIWIPLPACVWMQLLVCSGVFLSGMVIFASFAGGIKVAFQGPRRRSIEGVIEPSGVHFSCYH